MATADDVATYILAQRGPMSTWKLQKLVYYCQAWHLAWEEEPLFPNQIEAWANGPVVRDLYNHHRGQFTVNDWQWGDPDHLEESERDTIDIVLANYGEMTGRQLSHLTHSEAPWRDAREGLRPTQPSTREIPQEALLDFYTALDADENARRVSEVDWSLLA